MCSTLANANEEVKQLLIYQTLNLRSNIGMDMPANRRKRLDALILDSFSGSKKSFCDATGLSESRLSQLLSKTYRGGKEPGEKAARAIEKKLGLPPMYLDQNTSQPSSAPQLDGDFGVRSAVKAVDEDEENTNIYRIRKVKLKLSAGIVGFSFEPEVEDANPIYFRKDWFINRGYRPEKLIAIRVKGQSMETGLHDGDTVVVNTADTTPIDGEVYAVNYEGEDVIKRLVRDAGSWWLSSDNPDQRRFLRKECSGDMCLIIGRVIHKQSERI